MWSRAVLSIIVGLQLSTPAGAEFFNTARFVSRPDPLTDMQGRVKYIVDFARSAADAFPNEAAPELRQRFQPWKSDKSRNFARSLEVQYGITVDNVISYIGPSITDTPRYISWMAASLTTRTFRTLLA